MGLEMAEVIAAAEKLGLLTGTAANTSQANGGATITTSGSMAFPKLRMVGYGDVAAVTDSVSVVKSGQPIDELSTKAARDGIAAPGQSCGEAPARVGFKSTDSSRYRRVPRWPWLRTVTRPRPSDARPAKRVRQRPPPRRGTPPPSARFPARDLALCCGLAYRSGLPCLKECLIRGLPYCLDILDKDPKCLISRSLIRCYSGHVPVQHALQGVGGPHCSERGCSELIQSLDSLGDRSDSTEDAQYPSRRGLHRC
jgi:hypothetical protein